MSATFVGVGAQKCASSWLHDILADHPDVTVPPVKELDFFSYRYENGRRWYDAQLTGPERAHVRGETSPSYFHEPAAAPRAHAYNPRFKVIVSLRDPVERALSQHRHMARLGMLPPDDLSFESAVASNPTYVDQGRYHLHLTRWIELFGKEQVHVVLHDDIVTDRLGVASRLYRFLGVDAAHRSAALDVRSNPSYMARNRQVETAIRGLRQGLGRVGLNRVWRAVGDLGLRDAYRSVNRKASEAVLPAPRPETLQEMRRTFKPEVERLSILIDRDLTAWLTAP